MLKIVWSNFLKTVARFLLGTVPLCFVAVAMITANANLQELFPSKYYHANPNRLLIIISLAVCAVPFLLLLLAHRYRERCNDLFWFVGLVCFTALDAFYASRDAMKGVGGGPTGKVLTAFFAPGLLLLLNWLYFLLIRFCVDVYRARVKLHKFSSLSMYSGSAFTMLAYVFLREQKIVTRPSVVSDILLSATPLALGVLVSFLICRAQQKKYAEASHTDA